jgi:hypothetical protein
MRYINPWLADGYCSITITDYILIRFIKFISRISTHLCKRFYKIILFNTLKNRKILFSIIRIKLALRKPNRTPPRESRWSSGPHQTRTRAAASGPDIWFDQRKAKRCLLSKTIKAFIFLQHLRNTIRDWVVFVALFYNLY